MRHQRQLKLNFEQTETVEGWLAALLLRHFDGLAEAQQTLEGLCRDVRMVRAAAAATQRLTAPGDVERAIDKARSGRNGSAHPAAEAAAEVGL